MSALAEWELLLALPIDRALPWAERERRKDRVPAPAQVGGRAGICSGEAEAGLRVLFDLMAARQSQATRRAAGQPPGCAFGLSDGLGEGLLAPQGGAQDVAFGPVVPVVLWPRLPHLSDGGKRSAVASGVQSLPGRVAPGLASWAGCPGWERPSMLRRHSSGPRRGGWLPNAGLLVWRAAGPLGGSRELGCARPRALALSRAPQPCLPSRLSLALLCAGRRVRGASPGAADLRSVWVVAAFGLGPRAEGCWWIPRLLSRPQEQALGLQGVGGCRGDSPANPCRASPRCTQVERRKDLSPRPLLPRASADPGVRLGEAGQGPGALQLEPVSARRRQSTSRAPCARSCPGRPLAQAPARRWVGGRPRRFPGPCPRGMVPRTPWPDAPRLRGEAGFCHPKRHSVGWGRVARRWEGVAGWLRSEGVSLARWAADLSSQQQQACPWDVQVWRLSPAWCLASGSGASGGECGTSVWWCFGGRT